MSIIFKVNNWDRLQLGGCEHGLLETALASKFKIVLLNPFP